MLGISSRPSSFQHCVPNVYLKLPGTRVLRLSWVFLPKQIFPGQAIAPCVHLIQSYLVVLNKFGIQFSEAVRVSAMFYNRCFGLKETGKTSRRKTLTEC